MTFPNPEPLSQESLPVCVCLATARLRFVHALGSQAVPTSEVPALYHLQLLSPDALLGTPHARDIFEQRPWNRLDAGTDFTSWAMS